MALYAIGDLHLGFQADKPMDIFGGPWTNHVEKLKQGFSQVTPEDTTVLLGDLSWALDLKGAEEDFAWISQIPGRKIILKGNHDYWWSTASKFYRFCQDNGFSDLNILNNNCYTYEGWAICGTRGWFYEEERDGAHDEKVMKREILRLEASLKAAGDLPKLVFLHYPPVYKGYCCEEELELLHRYDVRYCYYGHLHGASQGLAIEGLYDGITYKLVAADKLDFCPLRINL